MTETSHFDWPRFASAVKAFLDLQNLTYRAASTRFGGAYAMWYRAQAGHKLSVGNALFVARTAGLDIYDYSVFARRSRVKHASLSAAMTVRACGETPIKQGAAPVSCENGAETNREARG